MKLYQIAKKAGFHTLKMFKAQMQEYLQRYQSSGKRPDNAPSRQFLNTLLTNSPELLQAYTEFMRKELNINVVIPENGDPPYHQYKHLIAAQAAVAVRKYAAARYRGATAREYQVKWRDGELSQTFPSFGHVKDHLMSEIERRRASGLDTRHDIVQIPVS
jgi:hypothetical protein